MGSILWQFWHFLHFDQIDLFFQCQGENSALAILCLEFFAHSLEILQFKLPLSNLYLILVVSDFLVLDFLLNFQSKIFDTSVSNNLGSVLTNAFLLKVRIQVNKVAVEILLLWSIIVEFGDTSGHQSHSSMLIIKLESLILVMDLSHLSINQRLKTSFHERV